MVTPIPQAAIDAAYEADLAWLHSPDRERGGSWAAVPEPQLRRLLEAAAPHLAAAERERCAQLAGELWGSRFADALRPPRKEPPDG